MCVASGQVIILLETRQAHLQKHSSQSNIGGHLGSQLLDRGGVLLCVHMARFFLFWGRGRIGNRSSYKI
jgi:hypothetical protein